MNKISLRVFKGARKVLTYAAADTVKSTTYDINGFLRFLIVEMPNFTTAATGVLTILNSDGNTLYTSVAIAENGTSNVIIADGYVPLTGETTFTLTLNAGAGGDHSVYITPYVR